MYAIRVLTGYVNGRPKLLRKDNNNFKKNIYISRNLQQRLTITRKNLKSTRSIDFVRKNHIILYVIHSNVHLA